MQELLQLKQLPTETVEDYTRKFRKLLRKATHGQALADAQQTQFYVNGLQAWLQPDVRVTTPGTVNDAVTRAKLLESSYGMAKLPNLQQILQNINQTTQLNQQPMTNQQINNIANNQQKSQKNEIDELTEQMKNLTLAFLGNQVDKTQPKKRIVIVCGYCGKTGHFKDKCYKLNPVCYNCKRPGHTSRDCPN